jgi:hypothetical protein
MIVAKVNLYFLRVVGPQKRLDQSEKELENSFKAYEARIYVKIVMF